jgi:hypothetical protein
LCFFTNSGLFPRFLIHGEGGTLSVGVRVGQRLNFELPNPPVHGVYLDGVFCYPYGIALSCRLVREAQNGGPDTGLIQS